MSTYLKIITIFLILLALVWSCGDSKKEVIITAHRGASGLAPENTMSAMLKAIDKVKELNSAIRAGYIFSKMPKDVDVFTANVDLLSVNYKLVDKEFVDKAHANNKEVHVWTVNEPEEMNRLIGLGVDSIITNHPDILKKILSEG